MTLALDHIAVVRVLVLKLSRELVKALTAHARTKRKARENQRERETAEKENKCAGESRAGVLSHRIKQRIRETGCRGVT